MIDLQHFHLNQHPFVGFTLMVLFMTGSVIVNFMGVVQDVVPLFQLAAYCMTIYVGVKTVKNLGKKENQKDGDDTKGV
tara:strand:- start:589 stop:822 length:234 start_codon:yes stop_codon:yes gene_type:complete